MKTLKLTVVLIAALTVAALAANEIAVTINVIAQKGFNKVDRQPGTVTLTWNSSGGGTKYMQDLLLDTEYAALSKGAVTNLGYAYLRNVQTNSAYTNTALTPGYILTNTALLSFDGGTNLHMILRPGENAIFRFNDALNIGTVAARAYSNEPVRLEFLLLED